MTVGIDIDDTITRHPEFFAFLTKALINAGHQVVIITFRENRNETFRFLEDLGIVFTKLVTSSLEQHLEYGVDQWKGRVCEQEDVDVLFDDDPEVLRHVNPNTVSFMTFDPSGCNTKKWQSKER